MTTGRGCCGAGLVHGPIPEERIEDAGQATGERDDGDLFAAAGGDVERPAAERVGRGGSAPEDGDGGLHQEPPDAGMARLGDVATTLGLARAVLARHEAKVRLDLVGVTEAPDIVEGRDEGGGGDRADAGNGAQPLDPRVLGGQLLDGVVGGGELGAEMVQDRQQRGDRGPQPIRQRQGGNPLPKGLGTAGGHAVALLAEEGADQGDITGPGPDQGVTDSEAAAHMPLGIGQPMGGR